MEHTRQREYILDVFADPACVKDVVKAILHTIFFHRYFIPIRPVTCDLLDTTLPAIDDVDLETLIDQRANALARQIDTSSSQSHQSGRGQLTVHFFETRQRKSYFAFGKTDDELCWEQWRLDVTLATPRTETDAIKMRRAMEKSLQKTVLKIVNIVNRDKDHIPPITTTDANPFPYDILVNPNAQGWNQRNGIFR